MEKFRDWFHDKCLSMSIDLALLKESKAKKNIELYNNTVRLLELTWNHQQAKIDKLEAEKRELVEALEKWQGYSDGVVLDKKGHSMTEKDIYDYVEEVLTKIKSEGSDGEV